LTGGRLPFIVVLYMSHRFFTYRFVWFIAAGLVAMLVVACGGGDGETLSPTVVATPTSTRPATPTPYAAEEAELRDRLRTLFTRQRGVEINAVRLAGETGNTGFIAPIVDLASSGFAGDERFAIATALNLLTDQTFDTESFTLHEDAYRWLGQHPEIEPVPGYAAWKGDLYGNIDRRFIDFFYEGVPARVPLSGAQWGGVGVDGIPPLDNPKFTGPDGATYLDGDEPVFGISINGDARAYPLRILAWHELSNDVVGGKPVALVY
jgi:hypothetical protein